MVGYDLDDTLAKVDWEEAGRRGLANVFASAKVIHRPTQDFIVITARAHSTSAMKTATEKWLRLNFPNYKGIYYVSGSEKEVANAKARLIRQRRLTSFTDNNRDILAMLKELVPASVNLYQITGGEKKEI